MKKKIDPRGRKILILGEGRQIVIKGQGRDIQNEDQVWANDKTQGPGNTNTNNIIKC